jgi:hypothetical protein
MSDTAPVTSVKSAPEPLTHPEEPSIGTLVATISSDLSTLVQHEIALVKSEVKVSVKNGGLAAGLFAAAAFLLVLAVIMLSVAFAYLIHLTGLDLAFCYLIVFVVYAALAGLLAFVGIKKIQNVGPPERAIAQAQETKKVLTSRG